MCDLYFYKKQHNQCSPSSRAGASTHSHLPPAYSVDADDIRSIDAEVDDGNSRKLSVVTKDGDVIGEVVVDGVMDFFAETEIEGVRHLRDQRTSTRQ